MATTSFDKSFVVTNQDSVREFKDNAKKPLKVVVKQRDFDADRQKGIQLLKRHFSASVTS
jgi:hypothetical protein